MPRHTSPATSSRAPLYLAASDFDLIVGGAGRPETLAADPYLPGGHVSGGGGADLVPVEATAVGAADGPGFTWPDDVQADTVDGSLDGGTDPFAVAPPMSEGAADGAGFTWPADAQLDTALDEGAPDDGGAPHMCGTMPPEVPDDGGAPGDGWSNELDDGGGYDPADGDSWSDSIDPSQGWTEPPMTLDGLDDIQPFEATEAASTIGMVDGVGDRSHAWSDVVLDEVVATPYDDGPAQALGDDDGDGACGGDDGDGDDGAEGMGCHAGGGGGDGGGNGDGSGGHHGGGCGDDDDAPADAPVDQIQAGQPHDPLSWQSTVSQAPVAQTSAPQTHYERPSHAADVNTIQPPQAQGHNADQLLDWAFSPRGPVAGAVGGDFAQGLSGLIDRVSGFLRR